MEGGTYLIRAKTIQDCYKIIKEAASKGRYITYSEVINELRQKGNRIVNQTIGCIVGSVSETVAENMNPSIYPSSIVVKKDTIVNGTPMPGERFWCINAGTDPPAKVPQWM